MIVKVCGITRLSDIKWLEKMEIDLIGFILYSKSPRKVELEFVDNLCTKLKKVGVVVDKGVHEIQNIMNKFDFVQLHGDYDFELCKELEAEKVIKVVWPERYDNVSLLKKELDIFLPFVKYFLFDAGKSLGGHGRIIEFGEWIKLLKDYPIFLAGGINPHNLGKILEIGPLGIDLNSGVESRPGIKSKEKVSSILKQINFKGEKND
ncbi:phosphoribosylanthranilate isomerase [Desulfonauticus submarinus]|uniref:N-(5'-phosphoribosyl)anthranilate isomerase n=1 Tax=Desulfonauticus submarinus TaxID=206665 RepID=A0A1H0BHV8_9BACT|nr:phosphoribosylanthranilate isomerase [Desulfonauticus submarinus]SDN45230.1 phosphoribosylanthranilate isomerase [Desulfonauticus submarinus]